MKTSFPKHKIQTLLLENIHRKAVDIFSKEEYPVIHETSALYLEKYTGILNKILILGIRSKTQLTEKVSSSMPRLIALGAYCVGTNQIDLEACEKQGIAVFNAPYSNTRSVVELTLGGIIMVSRGVSDKSQLLHQGKWDKSSKNSYEIRGKKLGIIGYGSIGSQLSVLAEALGMHVYYYDIQEKLALGNAHKCRSLDELLTVVDYVSVHVDGRPENKKLINEQSFKKMKDGVFFLNLSRGFVVDIHALAQNLQSGKVRGAVLDVYPEEPKGNLEIFSSELQNIRNVILTPHIGGSTEEAQLHIAEFVSEKIIQYVNTGNTTMCLTIPNLHLPSQKNAHRVLHIHENVPGILAQINKTFSRRKINIVGQYLKTSEHIGYVITDINQEHDADIMKDLKVIPHTIKSQILN